VVDETEKDAAGLGIDAPSLPAVSEDFEVWQENWDIVLMFLRMQTQWNVTMGGYVGLNYETLRWFCDLYSIEDVQAMLEGIQVMEAAALGALNRDG
jgi:hypothetical protein